MEFREALEYMMKGSVCRLFSTEYKMVEGPARIMCGNISKSNWREVFSLEFFHHLISSDKWEVCDENTGS